MKFSDNCKSLFENMHAISDYRYYLVTLASAIEELEKRVNDYYMSFDTSNINDVFSRHDPVRDAYGQAIGNPAYNNLFDTLVLRLAYILSRAHATEVTAQWMVDVGIPAALVRAANSLTLEPGESNPLTLVDEIKANPQSFHAALKLFNRKTSLLDVGEVTPEKIHTAKQYVEAVGEILNSKEYQSALVNWGPLKIEKLNALMHPNACEDLRKGGFFIRIDEEPKEGLCVRVYMTNNEEPLENVANIEYFIARETGAVVTTIQQASLTGGMRCYIGLDRTTQVYGPMLDMHVDNYIRHQHIRFNRFKI